MIGRKFGMLRVLQKVNKKTPAGNKGNYYRCSCDCGSRITVERRRLLHKQMPKLHCGCENQGLPTKYKKEYHAWWDCIQRCYNTEHHGYSRYGEKGVRVCDAWKESFEAFFRDLGPRPKGHSLDRVDPEGNYEPGNVRWADDKTQARNKRSTKWVRHPTKGEPIRAAELAEELGMSYQNMRAMMIRQEAW